MLKIRRLALAAILLIGYAPMPALAAPPAAAQNHEQSLATPVGKFIQQLGDQAIAVIADKNLNQDQRTDKFRDMLSTSFDLPTIGRFVIGRSWNAASPGQQQEYMKLFESLVIKTYSDRFALYTGEGFQVTAVRPESEKDSIVNSEITHPDGSEPTSVDWRVRNKDGKLGIIDVVVEGVSLSVTQRQEYASIIQHDGGKLDGLLALMRKQLQSPNPPSGSPG
jgi:phospholipid transport system substrate-binding protein